MTIRDIAKACHVSVATVSRVMNNDPKGVSKETRLKVLKIINDMGYEPNAVARSLATQKAKVIGLILPDISNPFNAMMAKGVEEEANKYGYNTVLCDSYNDIYKEKEYLKILNKSYVSGIIYNNFFHTLGHTAEREIEPILPSVPFVVLDDVIVINNESIGISINNERAMFELTCKVLEKGHTRIAAIIGRNESYATQERLKGFWQGIHQYNVPKDHIYIAEGEYSLQGGYTAINQLLTPSLKITAVICFNDIMAIGLMHRIKELKFNIPGDLSITGFDNIVLSNFMNPPLTTVEQPVYDMGKYAAYALIQKIEYNQFVPLRKVFNHRIVITNSLGEA